MWLFDLQWVKRRWWPAAHDLFLSTSSLFVLWFTSQQHHMTDRPSVSYSEHDTAQESRWKLPLQRGCGLCSFRVPAVLRIQWLNVLQNKRQLNYLNLKKRIINYNLKVKFMAELLGWVALDGKGVPNKMTTEPRSGQHFTQMCMI